MAEQNIPTQAEVDALAQVLYEAWERGIRFGTGSLARHILAAGYRRSPEPEPVRLCAQCQLGRRVDVPVGDPRCPHTDAWFQGRGPA